ncbi:MAG: hypothetical protein ABSB19_07750 [Methylomonas sp.]|jgi:hypothetical protein
MSHVNAEKAVAAMGKMDMGPKMGGMGPMMMEGMGPKMMEGMGPMMMGGMMPKMMEGMGPMMMEGMTPMMKMPAAATGVIVYTGANAGKSVIRKVVTHPLVVFSLGVVLGCYVYKYRKCILSACAKRAEE